MSQLYGASSMNEAIFLTRFARLHDEEIGRKRAK